jgi:hypothetical protein
MEESKELNGETIIDICDHIQTDSSPESNDTNVYNENLENHLEDSKKHHKHSHQGWNDQNNRLAIIWMMRCTWMEKSLYKRFNRLSVLWMSILFFQICINAIASALAILNLGAKEYIYQNFGVSIDGTLAVLNILGTVIAALMASVKFPKAIEKIRYGIIKFSKLIRTIEKVVNTNAHRRPDADKFLDYINFKYYKYHTSGKLLVEENINFRMMKHRITQASHFNKIDNPILAQDDDKEDYVNILSKSKGLLKSLKKYISPKSTPTRSIDTENDTIPELHSNETTPLKEDQSQLEQHDFIKGDYIQGSSTKTL